jgi:predicted DNA binding protein
MKSFKIVLEPAEGSFHSVGGMLVTHPDVTPRRLTHLELLQDDTVVAVTQLEGDADALEGELREQQNVIKYDITSIRGDLFNVYTKLEPTELVLTLLTIADEHDLVLDTPFEIHDDGGVEVTVAGLEADTRKVIEAFPRDQVGATLKHVSEFEPTTESLITSLTETQREILEHAVEEGYYSPRRETTQAEIAADFDCSAATVGEHLRKVENEVLSKLV